MKNILGIGDNFEEQLCHWCKKDLSHWTETEIGKPKINNDEKRKEEWMKEEGITDEDLNSYPYNVGGVCFSGYSIRKGYWYCVDMSKQEVEECTHNPKCSTMYQGYHITRYDCRGKKV